MNINEDYKGKFRYFVTSLNRTFTTRTPGTRDIKEYLDEQIRIFEGIEFLGDMENINHNYAYFPIFINEDDYAMSRNDLYEKLKQNNIYGRRYFYPLISKFNEYVNLHSANDNNLPNAKKMSEKVICLPIYPNLDESNIIRIIKIVKCE